MAPRQRAVKPENQEKVDAQFEGQEQTPTPAAPTQAPEVQPNPEQDAAPVQNAAPVSAGGIDASLSARPVYNDRDKLMDAGPVSLSPTTDRVQEDTNE